MIAHSIRPFPLPWRLTSGVRASATLVVVLIRKWLQPSGFTQNVQRTRGNRRWAGRDCVIETSSPRRQQMTVFTFNEVFSR
jgi:hypothetical protein